MTCFCEKLSNSDAWKDIIRQGLQQWMDETCMTFVENPSAKNRLTFIKGSGCYSSVGMVGGEQTVSIGEGCDAVSEKNRRTTRSHRTWVWKIAENLSTLSKALMALSICQFLRRSFDLFQSTFGFVNLSLLCHFPPIAWHP